MQRRSFAQPYQVAGRRFVLLGAFKGNSLFPAVLPFKLTAGVVVELTTAVLTMTAQSLLNTLTLRPTSATFTFSPKNLALALLTTLTSAVFTLTAQNLTITLATLLELGVAQLSFVAQQIQNKLDIMLTSSSFQFIVTNITIIAAGAGGGLAAYLLLLGVG